MDVSADVGLIDGFREGCEKGERVSIWVWLENWLVESVLDWDNWLSRSFSSSISISIRSTSSIKSISSFSSNTSNFCNALGLRLSMVRFD